MSDGRFRWIPQAFAFACVLACLSAGCRQGSKQVVTLQSCLRDLTNVNVFAQTPVGRAGMIGTYDPTGGNSDWAQWTQDDVGPDGLITLADLEGPGKITRIWQASVPGEEWLFFFDGEEQPRMKLSCKEFFGGRAPFHEPLAMYRKGECFHSYFPLPFQKSFRLAIRPGRWARPYYQINYEVFPKRTEVESFPAELSAEDMLQAEKTALHWREKDRVIREAVDQCQDGRKFRILGGAEVKWFDVSGAGTLETFAIKVDVPDGISPLSESHLWRQLVLRFWWDGASHASVDVPLGDFFCNAFHRREFSSLPVAYVDGAYVCRFPMPFKNGAKVEIRNDSKLDLNVSVRWRWNRGVHEGDVNYFHSRWNSAVSQGIPYNLLNTTGEGHYVGCFLLPIGMDGSWFIVEADDYTFLDGEQTPTILGCGMEDYFNGAWYYLGLFDNALCGLTEKAPVHLEQYRFMLGDPIAFKEGIQANWEFGHGNQSKGYMSSVAYWYQTRPVPAASSLRGVKQRYPPRDPVRPAGMMSHLFEFERLGEYAEAGKRCLEFAEMYPDWELSPIVKLRAVGYAELEDGPGSVSNLLSRVLGTDSNHNAFVVQQAQSLAHLYAGGNNALVGAHAQGDYKLYIDGVLVLEGKAPEEFRVRALTLHPGAHELSAVVRPGRMDPWFSMCLRGAFGSVRSGKGWESTDSCPQGWPRAYEDSLVRWRRVPDPYLVDMLPRSTAWRFIPNVFVGMQSEIQLLRKVVPRYDPAGRKPTYLRYRFLVPEEELDRKELSQ